MDAEFLWWFGEISNLSYAIRREGIAINRDPVFGSFNGIAPTKKEHFEWEWNPGVRLGLGVITDLDGWDLYTNWTYFYTKDHQSKSVAPLSTDLNSLPVGQELYNNISGCFGLTFNQIDLEHGRQFWISRNLTFRPSMGIRGYWSWVGMNVEGRSGRSAEDTETGAGIFEKTKIEQKSWGVGLLAGFETVWHFYFYWSVFSSTEVALTYGKFKQKKTNVL